MIKAIIGNGGFAREIKSYLGYQKIPTFIDDKYINDDCGDNILPLSKFNPNKYEVIIAIGDPRTRFDIVQKLPKDTKYWTYIHPSAQIFDGNIVGEGSIICPGVIITNNINIGDHCHLNLLTTIGHDCEIGDYFTTAPGAKISGNCKIYDCVYIGTNASVKEKITIPSLTTIGLNAGVVKNIVVPGIYIGTPAQKIKRNEDTFIL